MLCLKPRNLSFVYSLTHKTCVSNLIQRNLLCIQKIQPDRLFVLPSNEKERLVNRVRNRFSKMIGEKTRIRISTVKVYEKLADSINWKEFFDYFQLPDTFQTWFLAIQLHVWMCIVATISEKNGRLFRHGLVEALWKDVEFRLEELKLEIPLASERRKYLEVMVAQFQACLISYDEGILSDDTVLAAAVWRTLFNFDNIDPRILETAVFYIRKQVSHLDSLNSEDFILKGTVTFLPVNSILKSNLDQ